MTAETAGRRLDERGWEYTVIDGERLYTDPLRGLRDDGLDATRTNGHQAARGDQAGAVSEIEDRSAGWPHLDPVAYHGLAGRVVGVLEPQTEADPAGLLLTFLAFFGNAVGTGPHAMADGSRHPARLNVAVVGDTSRSRKGTGAARIRSIFELADPTWSAERILSGFGSGEALVDSVADKEETTDKRLLVLESEFVRILAVAAREGSTLSAIMRDAWDRDRLAARSRQHCVVATGAHVSFVAHITVEELRRRLSETEMANGLANRFLFGCVRRSHLLPDGGRLEPHELAELGRAVRDGLVEARKITQLKRSDAAEKRWASMYAEMADGPDGLVGAVTARAEAQTLRLSVAYALLDGSRVIDEDHLVAAYALWRYCEASVTHIFGDLLGDNVADPLLKAIRAAGDDGLDFTAQSGVFGRHIPSARLALARTELGRRGLIRTESVETGGRPRMVSYATAKQAQQAKEGAATGA